MLSHFRETEIVYAASIKSVVLKPNMHHSCFTFGCIPRINLRIAFSIVTVFRRINADMLNHILISEISLLGSKEKV